MHEEKLGGLIMIIFQVQQDSEQKKKEEAEAADGLSASSRDGLK